MNSIDLIPADYRTREFQRTALKALGIGFGVIVATTALGASVLNHSTDRVQQQVTELETRRNAVAQQQAEFNSLSAQSAALERELAILNGLRSGAEPDSIFITIDNALADLDVWFDHWQFERARVLVGEAQADLPSGYFSAVPTLGAGASDTWAVETRMRLEGQALDYVALSEFVDSLSAQPEIVDVRVQNTSLQPLEHVNVVNFDLEAILNSEIGD